MPTRALTVVLALTFSSGFSVASAQVVRGKVSGAQSVLVVPQLPGLGGLAGVALSPTGISPDIGLLNTALPSLTPISPVAAPRIAALPNALPAVAPTAALFAAPAARTPAAALGAAGAAREKNDTRAAPGEAARAQAARIAAVTEGMRQDLALARDEKSGGEASKDAAARLLEPSAKAQAGGDPLPVAGAEGVSRPSLTRRYAPLLSRVAFHAGATEEQKALLADSLSRRKAGWTRGLERSGLKLKDGQPEVTVLSAETRVSKKNPADYTVTYQLEWKISETKLGRLKVTINSLKLEPYVSSLPLPTPPKERQLLVRFKARTLESAGGLSREISIGEKEIKALAEELGLRVLWHSYKGEYALAAPAGVDMASAERKLLASDLVVDARPAVYEVPAENQVKLAFKKSTRYSRAGRAGPHEVDDTEIANVLRALGLRVLSVDFGVWTVGAPTLDAARAARDLMATRMTLYAVPAVSSVPESRQVVVKLRRTLGTEAVGEDEVADFLLKNGARVVKALGDGYKLEVSGDNAAAAAKLAKDPLVERAAAVGALTDDAVRASAAGTASYKGRPWSSTEYNAAWGYAYEGLEAAGATKAQLELFEKLTAEAPVRGGGFNPWSGD